MPLLWCEKVFDAGMSGTDQVFTSPRFDELLGTAETFFFFVRVTQVTGTSPTMTVASYRSIDQVNFELKKTLFSATSIPGTDGKHYNSDTGSANITGAFGRISVQLGGTNPNARVEIWVAGRGRTRRAQQMLQPQPSGRIGFRG